MLWGFRKVRSLFRVTAKRRVLKVLEGLDRERRKRFEEVFSILKKNPIPFRELDVVKLRGYENTYRIRIGNYRIVYEVLWDEKRIIIHFIGRRKAAYRRR